MIGSLGSSSHEGVEEQDEPSTHVRHVLITCAEFITQSNFLAANQLITVLSSNSSPYGDSTERLAHQFTKSLSHRINLSANIPLVSDCLTPDVDSDDNLVQSSYLTLNQLTPFIRFCHLTANQAILEAVNGAKAIHVLDFDTMHGVQWPPFMQALAERCPPPALRITGTGHDLDVLHKTGDRLSMFAHSLGLRFQFHSLLIHSNKDAVAVTSALLLLPDETLAVNCMLYLHRLLKDRDQLRIFLHRIKSMNPSIVTISEREANHNHPIFLPRFIEALDHYAAVFSSLEATLPPTSRERLVLEQIWFGREIKDIVSADGDKRNERHERFRSWEVMMRSLGFANVPLSPFALSQAKLLLRLHYPSDGYQLHHFNNSFFLGWQNQLLFSVSSWR